MTIKELKAIATRLRNSAYALDSASQRSEADLNRMWALKIERYIASGETQR